METVIKSYDEKTEKYMNMRKYYNPNSTIFFEVS